MIPGSPVGWCTVARMRGWMMDEVRVTAIPLSRYRFHLSAVREIPRTAHALGLEASLAPIQRLYIRYYVHTGVRVLGATQLQQRQFGPPADPTHVWLTHQPLPPSCHSPTHLPYLHVRSLTPKRTTCWWTRGGWRPRSGMRSLGSRRSLRRECTRARPSRARLFMLLQAPASPRACAGFLHHSSS